MKRNFIPVVVLIGALMAGLTFTGCDSAIDPAVAPTALKAAGAVTTGGAGDPSAVTITGPLAVVAGRFALLHQGNVYYVTGLSPLVSPSEITEGMGLTITGEAAPILDRDGSGNSLFFGYSLKAATATING
jgi:hypothetical protein